MRKILIGGLLLGFSTLALQAHAAYGHAGEENVLAITSGSPFLGQRQAIEKKLADGKTYAELSDGNRANVLQALNRISASLEAAGSIEALSEEQRVKVFNAQEIINSLLTNAAEDSRLICERKEKTGSHRKETVCHTVAERKRMRETSEEALRKVQGATQLPAGG